MKAFILASIAAAALAAFAGPVAAQTGKADANATRTVDPLHAFGSINVYNVGLDPARVSAWAKTLNAADRQEMIERCAVIVQNQRKYYAETGNFCQTFAIAIAQSVSGTGAASQ